MDFTNVRDARIAIAGFPYDRNSSFLQGAAEAPLLIRQALHTDSSNMWTENGIDLGLSSTIADVGDCDIADFAIDIEQAIASILERKLIPISLGGDHSITYPILRAFQKKYSQLAILHFDAHPDIYSDFQGNRFSHASPFARIMEEKLVQRLVQLGIRTMSGHQRQQVAKYGVESIEMKDWNDQMIFDFDTIPVYISFDLDALDPAFACGVSHPEPGGLSTRDAVQTIQQMKGRIVGADIVEYNPLRDPIGITAMVAAKILKEIAAKILS
jgi:agmatinase